MKYDSKIALLGGIIDYAGTFPPAALNLNDALKRAAKWRLEGHHPWLMSKMALPLNDLKTLTPSVLYENGADGSPWLFTALGTPFTGDEAADFYKTIEWDLREIRRCHERWYYSSCRLAIISYETKLPITLTHSDDFLSIYDFVSPVLERTGSLTGSELRDFFLEISLEGEWEKALKNLTDALIRWLDENEDLELIPGIKVRTGGAVIPSSAQLAQVVSACTSNGLRFKATQGLHSSVTHGKDFGFVNLFAALGFAQAYGGEKFGLAEIQRCLEVEDKNEFKFSSDKFSWSGFELTCDEIETARRHHGATFGSCSLDEPAEALLKEFP